MDQEPRVQYSAVWGAAYGLVEQEESPPLLQHSWVRNSHIGVSEIGTCWPRIGAFWSQTGPFWQEAAPELTWEQAAREGEVEAIARLLADGVAPNHEGQVQVKLRGGILPHWADLYVSVSGGVVVCRETQAPLPRKGADAAAGQGRAPRGAQGPHQRPLVDPICIVPSPHHAECDSLAHRLKPTAHVGWRQSKCCWPSRYRRLLHPAIRRPCLGTFFRTQRGARRGQ